MIKMVVSDIDGTLLFPKEERISDRIKEVIWKLEKKGILFVAASGRSYSDLRYLFGEVANDIAFIASDGAFTIYQNQVIGEYPLEKTKALSFIQDVQKETHAQAAVYCDYMTYTDSKTEGFLKMMRRNMRNHLMTIEPLEKIQQKFLKIGIYYKDTIQEEMRELLPYWDKQFHRVYSSCDWMEYTDAGVNKGVGLEKLYKTFGVLPSEIVAIGDSGNDKEMLRLAGISYAMQHAPDFIKNICDHQTINAVEIIEGLL